MRYGMLHHNFIGIQHSISHSCYFLNKNGNLKRTGQKIETFDWKETNGTEQVELLPILEKNDKPVIMAFSRRSTVVVGRKKIYVWVEFSEKIEEIVTFPFQSRIVSVGCGYSFISFVDASGNCYLYGEVFDGTKFGEVTMTSLDNIRETRCGQNFAIFRSHDNKFYGYGDNSANEMGEGAKKLNGEELKSFLPDEYRVNDLVEYGAGANTVVFLFNDGTIYTRGSNSNSSFGRVMQNKTKVGKVILPEKAVAFSVGYYHVIVLLNNNKLYAWGYGCNGELGNGQNVTVSTPVPVSFNIPKEDKVIAMCSGYFHNYIVLENKKNNKKRIISWGYGAYNQHGKNIRSREIPGELSFKYSVSGVVPNTLHLEWSPEKHLYFSEEFGKNIVSLLTSLKVLYKPPFSYPKITKYVLYQIIQYISYSLIY
eukprot:TRINITY_DN2367_c0_g1_i2.p1 TRINITY_DN2367_c0_g1~~TRINITY_DN2367_c0_g1_i2.p1  ORF type:complete len:424 (-),score=80.89 TRINITY_DN2367_c0_g1_i2:32-1303(-)